jgi:predicted transcriptional regulator
MQYKTVDQFSDQRVKMNRSATLPAVRVSPELRAKAERLLRDGETLSSLVAHAVEHTLELRRLQKEFLHRGLVAAEEARTKNDYVSSADMIQNLEQQLEAASRSSVEAGKTRRTRNVE